MFSQKKYFIQFSYHLLFWIFLVLLNALVYMDFYESKTVIFPESFFLAIKDQGVELPSKLLFIYFNLLYLLPRFLLKQKYFHYLLSLVFGFIILGYAQKQIAIHVTLPIFFPNLVLRDDIFSLTRFIHFAADVFSLLVLTSAFKILLELHSNQKRTQELEKRQLSTELKLLKTQINPHFFFNTLNNLYGMAMENSKHTAAMILKLSEMMTYILYDSNSKELSLIKEVDAIRNYIQLEEIRYGDRVKVSLETSEELGLQKIPPLLFLPFVENAFKHGVSQERKQAWMNISVISNDNVIKFSIENSKVKDVRDKRQNGIGLQNVKRRLEILFPSSHELRILEEEGTYLIVLKLKMKGYKSNGL